MSSLVIETRPVSATGLAITEDTLVVDLDDGLSRWIRPNQLIGLLERSGFAVELLPNISAAPVQEQPLGAGLRVAGS